MISQIAIPRWDARQLRGGRSFGVPFMTPQQPRHLHERAYEFPHSKRVAVGISVETAVEDVEIRWCGRLEQVLPSEGWVCL